MSPKLLAYYHADEDQTKQEDNYIYLTYNNVVYGGLVSEGEFFSMSQYSEALVSENKLYANGGSEIWE